MRVASKVGNLPSTFGHARPLGSRIIRYVRDGQTDGQTKAKLIAPFPTVGDIIITLCRAPYVELQLVDLSNAFSS